MLHCCRAEQAAQGSLADLQRLLSVSGSMADLGTRVGAKPSAALRQALQLQCRAYLDHMHRAHITRLSGGRLSARALACTARARWASSMLSRLSDDWSTS